MSTDGYQIALRPRSNRHVVRDWRQRWIVDIHHRLAGEQQDASFVIAGKRIALAVTYCESTAYVGQLGAQRSELGFDFFVLDVRHPVCRFF